MAKYKREIEERVKMEAKIFVTTKGVVTVRSCAETCGVSKSTVHKDMTERLKRIDYNLYRRVMRVIRKNKAERHIRGGEATRRKNLRYYGLLV